MKPETKLRIIHSIQLVLAAIGALLTVADKVTAIQIIPPNLTQYWGALLAAAVGVKPLLLLLGDLFDDGEINNSFGEKVMTAAKKSVPVLIVGIWAWVLFGCATDTGDAKKDRQGRVTNAVLKDVFTIALQGAMKAGVAALQGQNGQDAASAAFASAAINNGPNIIGDVIVAYAGPQAQPIAQAARAAVKFAGPLTPADKVLVINTVGAAIQQAANQMPTK